MDQSTGRRRASGGLAGAVDWSWEGLRGSCWGSRLVVGGPLRVSDDQSPSFSGACRGLEERWAGPFEAAVGLGAATTRGSPRSPRRAPPAVTARYGGDTPRAVLTALRAATPLTRL